jgi:hypothetical protein
VRAETWDDRRVVLIVQAAKQGVISSAQELAELLLLLDFDGNKVSAASATYPLLRDRSLFFVIVPSLMFESDRAGVLRRVTAGKESLPVAKLPEHAIAELLRQLAAPGRSDQDRAWMVRYALSNEFHCAPDTLGKAIVLFQFEDAKVTTLIAVRGKVMGNFESVISAAGLSPPAAKRLRGL